MATRINTKFVITLASVLVLIVLSMVLAFTFLKKSAEDHARLAEEAMQRAEVALASGDIKVHNSELKRAAKHFGNAKSKDASNIGFLYGFMDAHDSVICDSLTSAGNELTSILAGAASIHDTLRATDEDRAVLYELLHERARMGLFSLDQNPIGGMYAYSTKRLDASPEDPVAQRYHAISLGYMAETKTSEDEVAQDIQALTDAAAANPDNPWMQSALARYHIGNARRLYRARGNQITEEVNASLLLAFTHANLALQLAEGNMPAHLEAVLVISDLRTNDDKLIEQFRQRQKELAVQLSTKLQDKANRDALFVEELSTAFTILRQIRPGSDGEDAFDGPAQALALAEVLTVDRPDMPGAFQILGNLQREANLFEEAVATVEEGLSVERLTNATQFVRDNEARLKMRTLLADLKCTLALRSGEAGARKALLEEADAIIDDIAKADTLQAQWREARVDFLRGRVLLAQNKPRQAVVLLERANQAYNSRDAKTLRLLAQTHTQLGNDKLVPAFYETIIQQNLRPSAEDLLQLINLYLNPGENQRLEQAQTQLEWYRKQMPGDVRAVRLWARLLAEQDKVPEAIAYLQEHVEKYPELQDAIIGYIALDGNTEGLVDLIRERIADRPEGEAMNMQLVSQLLNLISDPEDKKAEIDRLLAEGLDTKIGEVYKRVLSSGQPTLQDELDLIDLQAGGPADKAMRKFLVYQRRNLLDDARPLLDRAAELEPARPDVIEWQFRLALMDQRWPDAQEAITAMLKLPPNERPELAVSDCRFMRAQVLAVQADAAEEGEARNKKLREAVVAYNNALGQYSHYVDGWIQLGRLHFAQGNFFAAQDSLQEALNRQSKNVQALELMGLAEQGSGDQINALERFEQILVIQPNHPTALNRFTALAQQIGLAQRAVALREQISQEVPRNYANRRMLALLYAQNEAHDKAKQTIQQVIDAEGSTRQNMAALSQVYAASDNHDQAIRAMQDYLAGLGDQAEWRDHLLLAQAYEQAGKTGESDAAFAKAIEMEKANGTFAASLSHAQVMLRRGKAVEAAAMFEGLVKAYPDNIALKQQTAELFLRLGKHAEAEALAESLPASANRYRLLIRAANAQKGKVGLAIERAREAVDAYPSDFLLRLNLLELLRTQQDLLPQAQRDYSKLLTMAKRLADDHPDRVEAKVSLADVLLRLNRRAQATAKLEKALEFAPRHLATNERLFGIKLTEARELVSINPEASQEKAREALAIISILLESRPDVPALLRSAGQAAELAGITAMAVDYYRKSFEASRQVADLSAYATALLAAGQGADARAVIEDPNNATLVSNSLVMRALRGRAIAAAGQPDVATTLFGNLLKQAKEPQEQLMITGQVILTFGSEPTRAIAVVEDALGEDLPVAVDTALSSMLMRSKDYTLVAERLKKYVANPADDLATQFLILTQLALALQESGQLVEAKAAYELVYDKMKQHKDLIPKRQQVQMLNNMAYLLADQLKGYEKQAVVYAKQALDLMSDNVSAKEYALIEDTLGWAHFKAGEMEEAIRLLESSVEKYPMPTNRLHLGRAYLAMGDEQNKNRAVLVLEKAVNQAKAEGDEKMIAETRKWLDEAL